MFLKICAEERGEDAQFMLIIGLRRLERVRVAHLMEGV